MDLKGQIFKNILRKWQGFVKNIVISLINCGKLFQQMKTNLFPLNISAGTVLPIFNFLLT